MNGWVRAGAPLSLALLAGCGSSQADPGVGSSTAPDGSASAVASETAPTASAATSAQASASAATPVAPPAAPASFADEVAYLKKHGEVIVLASPGGGQVAVSPTYQGRVMTSAVSESGKSLGWVNRRFIDAGKTGTQFDNYGGEDRFWLGPEAGQYGLYFPKGKPFTIEHWKTPDAFQTGAWEHGEVKDGSVTFRRKLAVESYAGQPFELDVTRIVSLVKEDTMRTRFGLKPDQKLAWVGFETSNRIENPTQQAYTKDKGLVSVWILGMFNPSPDTRVVIPFAQVKGQKPQVNSAYFGRVPEERLKIDEKAGVVYFLCDGQRRSKIGLDKRNASSVAGSYSPSAKLLTIVEYSAPQPSRPYVNSLWETQKDPFAGDVVNSYNDGPTEPGKPSLGGFYELESSSYGLEGKHGASLVHVHRTYHFVGEPAVLDPIAKKALGVTTAEIAASF